MPTVERKDKQFTNKQTFNFRSVNLAHENSLCEEDETKIYYETHPKSSSTTSPQKIY